jgi:biopolymer transport protein ExbD
MAVSALPTKSGKKSLDAELNLVPFIDLLVCCICFLLLTAVWVQISHVKGSLRAPGSGDSASASAPATRVLVSQEGYVLSAGAERVLIPKQGPSYDVERLARSLRLLRAGQAEARPLTVAAEDAVAYRHLIAAMDVALGQGFATIQVSDDRAAL